MQDNQTGVAEQERETLTPDAIYKNNIYALVDDVKALPQFQGLTDEELKNNKSFFPLLVDYIYNNYIGELLGNKHCKPVAYMDIKQLDYLFNIYTELVYLYKWNDKPFIIEFSAFLGISRDTIYQWLNGLDNNNKGVKSSQVLTRERSDIVKRWFETCERGLLNGSDTIRDIFILKAKHGYKDNNNDINITVNHKQIVSAEDLPALLDLTGGKNG
jgi:hypothetical protein